jgi:E3 ubiquitin-protein ligase SIAH1
VCGRDTAFVYCGPELDKYVGGFKVPCPFEDYGCDSVVVYHKLAAHREACAYTPCHCAVAGCAFTASPPMLREHLAAEHSWRVVALPGYGMAIPLIVPTAPPEHHRLLVVKGDKRRLFVLSVRAVGSTAYWTVSVACVRASGAAEAGPQYVCILWAEALLEPGPGMPASKSHCQISEMVVASCAAPGGPAVDRCGEMVVPPAMLVGASRAIRLRVRINEVAPAPAPQLPAPN